MFIIVQETW